MRISCILKASELHGFHPDLILFPEGILLPEVRAASLTHPDAIIAGAVVENGRSRGFLVSRGRVRVEYFKAESDGRTMGMGRPRHLPVHEHEDAIFGLLVCMDVDEPAFSRAVIDRLRESRAASKVLCIPADMGDYWFSGDALSPQKYGGVHVVLCNHTKAHRQSRCKSFITDTRGKKIFVQEQEEPLNVVLPGSDYD